jgi:dephospho-CoA kinase
MIAGITGGVGCGKSTAARAFESRGFRRLDSDQIVREQVLTDPAVIASVRARYGDAVIETAGEESVSPPSETPAPGVPQPQITGRARINRTALAAQVFANDDERLWLEELTHPRVFSAWRAALAAKPEACWIVEVPLLFEKGLENWFDFTVCVACAPAQQLARLEQRGLPRALAGQRISKQLPLARKIELSDFVLWNEGSPAFLEAQVDRLAEVFVAA